MRTSKRTNQMPCIGQRFGPGADAGQTRTKRKRKLSARKKLNSAYLTGSLIIAGITGGITGSWTIFLVATTILVGVNLYNDEIRWRPR